MVPEAVEEKYLIRSIWALAIVLSMEQPFYLEIVAHGLHRADLQLTDLARAEAIRGQVIAVNALDVRLHNLCGIGSACNSLTHSIAKTDPQ